MLDNCLRGYPNKIRADQGSAFTSPKWQKLTEATGIILQMSGVESDNSIGIGERYHAPLRRIYNKIVHVERRVDRTVARKAMNDTMGPNVLVPYLLGFGMVPRFPAVNSKLPD